MINIDLAAGIVGSSLLGVIVVIVIVVVVVIVIFLIVVVFIIIIPCWSVFSLVGSAVILLLLLSACHIIVVVGSTSYTPLLSFQSKERWSQAVAAIYPLPWSMLDSMYLLGEFQYSRCQS